VVNCAIFNLSLTYHSSNVRLRTLSNLFLTLWLASITSLSVQATIISGVVTGGTALTAGGTFVKLTPPLLNLFGPPNSVGNDNFQSPNLFGFDEDQNILITAPLTANVGLNPIPAGTIVASHYIFFDPGPTERVVGTVTFDSDVLAIFTSTGTLADTDFLANTGVNYLNPTNRGLEAGDYVRVLTAFSPAAVEVPEPRTIETLGTGLALLLILLPGRLRNATAASPPGAIRRRLLYTGC